MGEMYVAKTYDGDVLGKFRTMRLLEECVLRHCRDGAEIDIIGYRSWATYRIVVGADGERRFVKVVQHVSGDAKPTWEAPSAPWRQTHIGVWRREMVTVRRCKAGGVGDGGKFKVYIEGAEVLNGDRDRTIRRFQTLEDAQAFGNFHIEEALKSRKRVAA